VTGDDPGEKKIFKTDLVVGLISLAVGGLVVFSVTREQGVFSPAAKPGDDGFPEGARPNPNRAVKKEGGKPLSDSSLPVYINDAYALFMQGVESEKNGNNKAAVAFYIEACKKDPVRKMYWANLGNAYMHENKFDKAIESFMEVYNRDVFDTFNLANLGYASQSQRNDRAALRYYLMALSIQPDLQDVWAEMYNVAHGLVMTSFYDRLKQMTISPGVPGNSDLVYQLNQVALADSPDDYYLLLNRVQFNLRFMRLTNVKEDIDKALKINPRGPAALLARAQMYNYMGEFDKAAEAYKDCLAVSQQPVAYAELGTIQMQQGKLDEALHNYGKATELGNDKPSWVATYNTLRVEKLKRDAAAGEAKIKAASIAQDKSGAK